MISLELGSQVYNSPIKVELLQEAVDTFQATGSNYSKTALILGIPRPTVQSRIEQARRRGVTPRTVDPNDPLQLKSQIKRLQSDLRDAQQERVDHAMIKHKIIGLTREVNDVVPPVWMKSRETSHSQQFKDVKVKPWVSIVG